MTLIGWDASHYDGLLSRQILAQAKSEGIAFFTHKIAEGTSDTEGSADDTALSAARDAGIEFLGGYLIPRSYTTASAQVDYWISLMDQGEPWWRTFPGWFNQIDLERWTYDNVPASLGIACAQLLAQRTGRWTIIYASHGQYGDSLAGWNGPLWNADYTSGAAGPAAAMYPGDGWAPQHSGWAGGWGTYSGKVPTFLQFTSSATIGGLTTCDASAFRGNATDLRDIITGNGGTEEMLTIVQPKGGTAIWVGDGILRRPVGNLTNLQNYLTGLGYTPQQIQPAAWWAGTESELGVDITSLAPQVQMTDAQVAALGQALVDGLAGKQLSPAQVTAAVKDALRTGTGS